jgi:hypothetical protein
LCPPALPRAAVYRAATKAAPTKANVLQPFNLVDALHQLLRAVAVAGLNEPRRPDELRGGLDREVEFNHGAAHHVEKESRCRVQCRA